MTQLKVLTLLDSCPNYKLCLRIFAGNGAEMYLRKQLVVKFTAYQLPFTEASQHWKLIVKLLRFVPFLEVYN